MAIYIILNAIWFVLIQNECILYRGVNWETFWSVKVLPEVIWFNHPPPAAASPSCVAGPQTSGCFLQPWPCVCSCTNYYSAKAGSSGCKKRGELRHCGSLSNLNLLRDLRSGNGCQYNVVLSIYNIQGYSLVKILKFRFWATPLHLLWGPSLKLVSIFFLSNGKHTNTFFNRGLIWFNFLSSLVFLLLKPVYTILANGI